MQSLKLSFPQFLVLLAVSLIISLPKHFVSGESITEPELIEGDIVLDETTAFAVVDYKPGSHRRKREVVRDKIRLWSDPIIPYEISQDMSMTGRKAIRKAFRKIARRTCIKFMPKQNHHTDYVNFISRRGCYSSIGRKGGEQVISIGRGCQDQGHAIHEIMHMLGFFHEHSRSDRDKYIKILWWNIKHGMERNFITYSHETTDSLNEPYDYSSIMHYNNKAFSSNGRDTIQAKVNPRLRFGDLTNLSKVDIKQLRKLYRCSQKSNVPCQNRYQKCGMYAIRSDLCETNYDFMKFYCEKSCGFC